MKTILVTAYAVNPFEGSENGTGWQMINQIARYHKVIAITRKNNRAAIESYIKENPDPNHKRIEFGWFDLPYWMRFWKKGGRGAMIYYYLWQFSIVYFIQKKKYHFDVAHNLNFHNDWTPSFLWRLGKPMIWGPIGHHPPIPRTLFRNYGLGSYFHDRLKWLAKCCFWTFDPFLHLTKQRASQILVINSSVKSHLGLNDSSKIKLLPAVGTEETVLPSVPNRSKTFTVLSVGRFVPLKGFDITIEAFARFYQGLGESDRNKVQLVLVGKGPMEKKLTSIAERNRLEKAVTFIQWMKRKELMELYRSSSVFLFPSHEGAGMVVPEAMSYGLPIICFDNCGPGEMINPSCGIKIPHDQSFDLSIEAFAYNLTVLFRSPEKQLLLSKGARKNFIKNYRWNIKGEEFRKIYEKL